jgi:hypothetical protein
MVMVMVMVMVMAVIPILARDAAPHFLTYLQALCVLAIEV